MFFDPYNTLKTTLQLSCYTKTEGQVQRNLLVALMTLAPPKILHEEASRCK